MTLQFDLLAFHEENHAAIQKIASDFRAYGVGESCVVATVAIAASGRAFQMASAGTGRLIDCPAAWLLAAARRMLKRQFHPAGFASLDEDAANGITHSERIAVLEAERNLWQRADGAGMNALCDALEGGTGAVAERLRVTRRRAQQILARAACYALLGDLFAEVEA